MSIPVPVPVSLSIFDVALIVNTRLTIDIDFEHCTRGDRFFQAIILTVARHPSLTQFSWQIPDGHEDAALSECLLYACLGGSIQELIITNTYYRNPIDGGFRRRCFSFYYSKHFEDSADRSVGGAVRVLEVVLLSSDVFEPYLLSLLYAYPDLQYTNVDMSSEYSGTILEMLASHPYPLRGFGLDHTRPDLYYSREIGRFKQLQRLQIPALRSDQVGRIIDVLATSGVSEYTERGGGGGTPDHQEQPLQDKDLVSTDTVVKNWDPEEIYRQGGDMAGLMAILVASTTVYESHTGGILLLPAGFESDGSFLPGPEEIDLNAVHVHVPDPGLHVVHRATRIRPGDGANGILDEELEATSPDTGCMDEKYWYYGVWNEYDQREEERWQIPDTAQEYTIAKSRNRHRSLRDRKRSAFRRPFKK
ncbi:hypothetical protein BGZ92_011710 [Podila epicladia]|nr:hypothetical protein BGZ92_011710 [Podila epicladia]